MFVKTWICWWLQRSIFALLLSFFKDKHVSVSEGSVFALPLRLLTAFWNLKIVLFLSPDWESAQKGYTTAKAHTPPSPWPRLPTLLKSLFFLSSFLLHPAFKLFETVPTRPHATSFCPNPTHQPFLHIVNGFNKYQKGNFTSSAVHFFQIPLQINQVILINEIFSGSYLDNLEWFFFIKLWWQKKIIFLQIHNAILRRVQ